MLAITALQQTAECDNTPRHNIFWVCFIYIFNFHCNFMCFLTFSLVLEFYFNFFFSIILVLDSNRNENPDILWPHAPLSVCFFLENSLRKMALLFNWLDFDSFQFFQVCDSPCWWSSVQTSVLFINYEF